MQISKAMKRMLLVIPGCILLSAVAWGQNWGPEVRVEAGFAPARLVRVDGRWEDRRWERDREWRERERREAAWRERQRYNEWRRCHRREEWRRYRREY